MPAAMSIADSDVSTPPPRKRLRKDSTAALGGINKEPRLFVPFRALGLITNHVPFVLQTRSFKGASEGPRIHILTCLGRSWALWEGGKMSLLFTGPDAPELISGMAMDGNDVWVTSGPYLIKYLRGKEKLRIENPLGTPLAYITVLGSQILALTEDGSRMLIWETSTASTSGRDYRIREGLYCNLDSSPSNLPQQGFGFQQSRRYGALEHPVSDAHLQIRFLRTPFHTHHTSPAIDVVGLGFASGEISVFDVRAVERLMRMYMEGGSVRALSFRSDGQPILASASSAGHIALWDLNAGGRLLHLVRGAHDGAVSSLEWVPGQPLLISSGEDNSVKQWLFDSPTSPPRLLKFRSGHHAPPHLIRYYGDDGKQLLTASRDRSSLAKKATSLSIPLASLKFPPVTSMSYSSARAKDWDDILTGHTDETFARTWTMQSKRLGKHTFGFAEDTKGKGKPRATLGSVKSTCVTACGNFGIAASSTGQIHMWNMQSGIRRRTFQLGPCPPEVANRIHGTNSEKQKERAVTGLATDPLNTTLVACTMDGTVNFFDFKSANLEHTVVLPSTAVSLTLQRDSGLLAVVCDDMVVRIIDIETRKIVRELGGFRGRILDITFSPDSRWLVATSLDSIIRTFDIPTGRLIDAFKTSSVATTLSFSPTNDFLATAHVDSLGVYLWANRAQYTEVAFHGIVEDEVAEVSLPSVQGTSEEEALNALAELTVQDKDVDVFSTPDQLDGELITLTLLPRSRWQTLLNLEVIQQRNKPKEPPKAPEKAPFFLPTLPGVEPRFAVEKKEAEPKKSQRLVKAALDASTVFYQKLQEQAEDSDYEEFFNYAKTLSPAALDLEIRQLVTIESLAQFMHALAQRLRSHRDFEAVETFMNVFLRMHGEVLIANEELQKPMETLKEVHQSESKRVLELIASSLGTLGFVRDAL
ncbi:WD-repeat-containing protein [Coprinopsis cinerea okayama7|uniref:WD-repeat-containing protein n=1 Tax=Coprinopsis cinerea (strain Okayama-7 / 130 / ATCC MYA-4618 / FGSC 9003) TaxID=240176 RepID=A8NEZ2_COPC7|nr:WD-repeat-containing protein [Coprinopsis cinerea okayama7\|eukprot:XP_001833169.2 WD-repeat-containing protein [Coprinopsis cinerea okayama7\